MVEKYIVGWKIVQNSSIVYKIAKISLCFFFAVSRYRQCSDVDTVLPCLAAAAAQTLNSVRASENEPL